MANKQSLNHTHECDESFYISGVIVPVSEVEFDEQASSLSNSLDNWAYNAIFSLYRKHKPREKLHKGARAVCLYRIVNSLASPGAFLVRAI